MIRFRLRRPRSIHPIRFVLQAAIVMNCLLMVTWGGAARALAQDGGRTLAIAAADEHPVEPYRGLVYRGEQIRAIRAMLHDDPQRARRLAQPYLNSAQAWLERGMSGIDALMPGDGAVHAYGLAGDPKTGGGWPRWGRADDVCSLDRPGEVRSPHTGDVYGTRDPSDPYHDPGDGWVHPDTGKRYYFKGVWNAYVVRELHEAIDDLSIAYMLTGDEQVARLGLHLLDRFAGWRARHPDDTGVLDWPHKVSPGYGFMAYMGNQANLRMAESALAFDLLRHADHADAPSAADPSLTVFENITRHYFDVFEAHYIERRGSLQNHAVAAFAAALAKGRLLGEPDLIRTGIDATQAFLDSCINRDGDYYEVSGSYGQLGRRYGGQLVALLMNYSPDQYDDPAAFPDPADYENRLKFGNDPRWYATAVETLYELPILGRYPDFGNAGPDRDVSPGRVQPRLSFDRATYLSFFYHLTDNPQWKHDTAVRFNALPPQAQLRVSRENLKRFGATQWLTPPPPTHTAQAEAPRQGSTLLPAKGIVTLRSGEGEHQRALFMRGGIGASHAQDDQMALILYGHGMVATGRYGYHYFGNPDHLGWGARSIAHNTAVVDEDQVDDDDRPRHVIFKRVPAADITTYVPRPPVQVVEMRNPDLWRQVTGDMEDYRRTAWLVDVNDRDYYFIDMFQIVGGTVHDDAWHSPYLKPARDDDGFRIQGAQPQPVEHVWVLAALDNEEFRDATFNHPDQSWGERVQGHSGLLVDLGLGDLEPQSWWNPPPKNGYGMIWNLQRATTDRDWTATWLLHDQTHSQRLHALNFDGMDVITGRTPTLHVDYRQRTAIARRRATDDGPLHSRFVKVNEIGREGQWAVREVAKLPLNVTGNEQDAVGLRVSLTDGAQDIALGGRGSIDVTFEDGAFQGRQGFIRTRGDQMRYMMLQAGTRLSYGPWRIDAPAESVTGAVTRVAQDGTAVQVRTRADLAHDTALEALPMQIRRPADAPHPYGHASLYQVTSAAHDGSELAITLADQSLAMGYVTVERIDRGTNTITATFPNELVSEPQSEYFNGRRISVDREPGRGTIIHHFVDKRTLVVDDASIFKAGDRLAIHTMQPGDEVRIPMLVTLESVADRHYRLRASCEVTLHVPAMNGSAIELRNQQGEVVTRTPLPAGRDTASLTIDIARYPHGIVDIHWQ